MPFLTTVFQYSSCLVKEVVRFSCATADIKTSGGTSSLFPLFN